MVLRKLFEVDAAANGKGPVCTSWSNDGSMLAVCGVNRRVIIVDRQGKTLHQFVPQGPGQCLALEWDFANEVVACLQEKATAVTLYWVQQKRMETIDAGMRDLCFMRWSKVGPQLALANLKGGLLIYNRQTQKKVPIVGTHSKRIIDGAWSARNVLAMIGEDKILSISDAEGGLLDQVPLKAVPVSVGFTDLKTEDRQARMENTVYVNVNQKSLFMHHVQKREPPIDMTFQSKYGAIATLKFTGDGYCLIGFQTGFVVLVSVHAAEMGNEICAVKAHRDSLADLSVCAAVKKVATVGDGCLRTFDFDDNQLSEQKSEKCDLDGDFGNLSGVAWTDDGQVLSVASKNGAAYVFLTKIPVLSASSGPLVLYMSGLRDMTVRNVDADSDVCRFTVDIEPTFVAVGPGTAAVAMNNEAHHYTFVPTGKKDGKVQALGRRAYPSVLDAIKVSSTFAAVLYDGKVLVHVLDEKAASQFPHPQVTLPDKADVRIGGIALTEQFLIYTTNAGRIVLFSLQDFLPVVEYPHTASPIIKGIFPNMSGTRVAFIDGNNAAFVLNPTTEVATQIDSVRPGTKLLLWDAGEFGILVGMDSKRFTTYVYTPNSRHGPTCEAVMREGSDDKAQHTPLPYGCAPVALLRGNVTCQMPNGSLSTVPLTTHKGVYRSRPVLALQKPAPARPSLCWILLSDGL